MLGTLITVGMLAKCPLCEAEPGTPETPAPVVLMGATEAGEILTLEVFEDGRVVTGDPTPIAWPEGHEGGRVTDLAACRYDAVPDASCEFVLGYDHHAETVFRIAADGRTVEDVFAFAGAGWHRGRGMAVNSIGTVFVVNGELQTIEVIGSEEHTVPIAWVRGLEMIESICFAPDGTLYCVGDSAEKFSRAVYTIDLHDGSATEVVRLGVSDLDALAWASDGMLYMTDANGQEAHLYRVDPRGGTWEDLGDVGVVGLTALTERPRAVDHGDTPGWPQTVTKPSR